MSSVLNPVVATRFDELWPDESVRLRRLTRYAEINASSEDPLVIHLTHRGFLSEVHVLNGVMLYALMHHKRLAVSTARFNGHHWKDYFASELPPADEQLIASIPSQDQLIKIGLPRFQQHKAWIGQALSKNTQFSLEALGINGDLLQAQRTLLRLFCRPTSEIETQAGAEMSRLGLAAGRFAAVQIRRGDKIAVQIKQGQPWIEGEVAAPEAVARLLEQYSPDTREVFLVTDDFAAVGELQAALPRRRVTSLCPEDQIGHDQTMFNAGGAEARNEGVRRLLVECLIAAVSDAFVGGYKSNISTFVANIHHDCRRCVSLDSRQTPLLWQ